MGGWSESQHRSSDWFEVVSTFWLLLTQVSQTNQHPVLCFPQGEPRLADWMSPLSERVCVCVCVCVVMMMMMGGRVRTVLVNKPRQLTLAQGCFISHRHQFTRRNIQLNQHGSPEGATVSRSCALWCLHRGIIHLHWLDKGNTCSETDAQRVYLSFRF